MDQYHFLVGEFAKNSPFIPAAASAQLFAWFAHIGEPVDRYGSKTGKVVKFSQRNYEKTLFAPETNGISLFSPRLVPKDDAAEASNCAALAVYEPAHSLLLAIRASQLPLAQLFQGTAAIPGLLDHCEYVYGYSETLGYGSGYARGYFQEDDAHPITFGRRDPGNNWGAITRNGRQDEYVRDVFPVNIFTQAKLDALPPARLQALRSAMQAHGRCEEQAGTTRWFLSGKEQAAARADLLAHPMLGSLIDN
jgi:hypothetical protein